MWNWQKFTYAEIKISKHLFLSAVLGTVAFFLLPGIALVYILNQKQTILYDGTMYDGMIRAAVVFINASPVLAVILLLYFLFLNMIHTLSLRRFIFIAIIISYPFALFVSFILSQYPKAPWYFVLQLSILLFVLYAASLTLGTFVWHWMANSSPKIQISKKQLFGAFGGCISFFLLPGIVLIYLLLQNQTITFDGSVYDGFSRAAIIFMNASPLVAVIILFYFLLLNMIRLYSLKTSIFTALIISCFFALMVSYIVAADPKAPWRFILELSIVLFVFYAASLALATLAWHRLTTNSGQP